MKSCAKMVVVRGNRLKEAPSLEKSITDLSSVTTVGLDLAKHVFQVSLRRRFGAVCGAKAIKRNKLLEFFASWPPCLVGLEACGSAHHWARELIKLGRRTDDASGLCEALCAPAEERRGGRGGDLRGGDAAFDALWSACARSRTRRR